STGKSEWLATFENGAMWFVAMLDCEGWGPAGFVGFAVDGIGDAESGRFLICFSAPEFNFICDGWIVKGIGFDAEFFDEKSAFAKEAGSAIHQIGIGQGLETKAADVS